MNTLRQMGYVVFMLACALPLVASVASSLAHQHKLPPPGPIQVSIPNECMDIAAEMSGQLMRPDQYAEKLDEFLFCRQLYAQSK